MGNEIRFFWRKMWFIVFYWEISTKIVKIHNKKLNISILHRISIIIPHYYAFLSFFFDGSYLLPCDRFSYHERSI